MDVDRRLTVASWAARRLFAASAPAPDCVKTVLDLSLTQSEASKRSENRLGTGCFSVITQACEPWGVAQQNKAVRYGTMRFSPQASARSMWDTPRIVMTRLRLYARVDKLNSARTFSSPFMRK